jgi:hypothetical protein
MSGWLFIDIICITGLFLIYNLVTTIDNYNDYEAIEFNGSIENSK